ncbi:MAG: hypothetical protein KME59_10820 [Trichormus sp. ATA11-4-KO1]|jgi:hypothetical protein|nr:hypothetical protein [Trichormus sp. ATA11-4-KO1]
MTVDIKDGLQIILALAAVITLVFRLAQLEANIQNRITEVDNRMKLALSEYKGHKEMVDYQLHGLNEKIDHKFKRLHDAQKEIQDFLAKTTSFIKREGS